MEYFKRRLKKRYMHLKRKGFVVTGSDRDYVVPELRCGNMEHYVDFNITYGESIKEVCDVIIDEGKSKTLIVADNKTAALRTTVFIAAYAEESIEESGWGIEYTDDDEYPATPILNLDFSSNLLSNNGDINYDMLVAICNRYEGEYVVFNGFDNVRNIDRLVEIIGYCKTDNQFVIINPSQLQHKSIQNLIYNMGYQRIVHLPELKDEYYMGVFDYLLKDSMYSLDSDVDVYMLYNKLKKKRGEDFCEEDIATLLDEGVKGLSKDNNAPICLNAFSNLISADREKVCDRLKNMEGLDDLKDAVREIIAFDKEQKRNDKLKQGHNHMIFTGNPGTGKTSGASLLAGALEEAGCSNGNFVVATRNELIGEYVGHTAPLIAKKFKEAEGGILFVDEAGFLLQRESGGYVDEAVKEFVRYMETETDVMVIFAMYPDEAKELMSHDKGLFSRIKKVVNFEDYSVKQLLGIAETMFEENGYVLDDECRAIIEAYLKNNKRTYKEQFGNARVVRNLVESCIGQVSLRHMDEKNDTYDAHIRAQDVRQVISNMPGIKSKDNISFGFCNNSNRLCSLQV